MTRKKYTHRRKELIELLIVHKGTPDRKERARFNELYDKAEADGFDPCPPANDALAVGRKREYYNKRERYERREYYRSRGKRRWHMVTRYRIVRKFRYVTRSAEDGAPYAYLLDYIGARPLSEFGWLCVGDTPEVRKSKR